MRRALLFCVGIVLGLAAEIILWNSTNLFVLTDGWHPAAFTRMVGVAVIVEGGLSAVGAALCFARALSPLNSAPTASGTVAPAPAPMAIGGGPVLPICGVLFLLAALGTLGQAQKDSQTLEVMDSMPGQWGTELIDDFRGRAWTAWTFCVLWLVLGGALLASPLFLKPRAWRFAWRINGVGCAIAVGGFALSMMGALICFANGLAMEGASKDVNFAGQCGVLAGAAVAVLGSFAAILRRSEP